MIRAVQIVAISSIFLLGMVSRVGAVTRQEGVRAAFNLLCQNAATYVIDGEVNRKVLKTIAYTDITTLANRLKTSPSKPHLLWQERLDLYVNNLAVSSCPAQ